MPSLLTHWLSDPANQNEPDPFDPRFFPKGGGTYCIDLSNRWDCYCIVDEVDYEWAKQFLWCHTYGSGERIPAFGQVGKDKIYARRSTRLKGTTSSGRPRYGNTWLHREICERKLGPPPSPLHVADHWNGDSLDNRRSNLRWATLSENARNLFGSAWLQTRMEL